MTIAISDISACIKVAACICGRDGVISETEERAMFQAVTKQFPDFGAEQFEQALAEFFNSNQHLEDYLSHVQDESLRSFTLEFAKESAAADGLDITENIALDKAYVIWGRKRNV